MMEDPDLEVSHYKKPVQILETGQGYRAVYSDKNWTILTPPNFSASESLLSLETMILKAIEQGIKITAPWKG